MNHLVSEDLIKEMNDYLIYEKEILTDKVQKKNFVALGKKYGDAIAMATKNNTIVTKQFY